MFWIETAIAIWQWFISMSGWWMAGTVFLTINSIIITSLLFNALWEKTYKVSWDAAGETKTPNDPESLAIFFCRFFRGLKGLDYGIGVATGAAIGFFITACEASNPIDHSVIQPTGIALVGLGLLALHLFFKREGAPVLSWRIHRKYRPHCSSCRIYPCCTTSDVHTATLLLLRPRRCNPTSSSVHQVEVTLALTRSQNPSPLLSSPSLPCAGARFTFKLSPTHLPPRRAGFF